MGNFWNRES